MEQFDNFMHFTGLFLIVLNAVLYIWSYIFNKKNIALFYLAIYLCICAIVMVVTAYLAHYSKANLHYSHIYFILQFVFLTLFYKTLFSKIQRKIVVFILYFVLLVLLIQYINNPSLIKQFNLFEIFITSFPIIIYSIIHLYNSLSKEGEYMIINSGILVYITTSTLIFFLGNYLSGNHGNTITKIWLINKVLYVLYLVLILIEWKKTFLPVTNKS